MAKKTQIEKFREAAKEAGTDDSEERFNKTLKDLATSREAKETGQNKSDKDTKTGRRAGFLLQGVCTPTGELPYAFFAFTAASINCCASSSAVPAVIWITRVSGLPSINARIRTSTAPLSADAVADCASGRPYGPGG
jgi:hypothetical protein